MKKITISLTLYLCSTQIGAWYGSNCDSPKKCDEVLLPIPVNVPLFGNEVFGDVLNLGLSHWGGS